MKENQIINIAIENLQKTTQIVGEWKETANTKMDGKLQLNFGKEKMLLNADVKTNVRMLKLPQILNLNEQFNPYILVADKLFPEIKLQLRENKVAYLEANGNFYYQKENKWIWIDGNAPLKIRRNNKNRAFTKTGLKVLFAFLLDENLLNLPYRQIAKLTKTAVGNVTNIINGLKEGGYLLQMTKNELRFKNRQEVILKWAENFQLNLKPQLMIGNYRFLNPNDFLNWENINLKKEKTYWGAEPAAAILTNYLKPQYLTLYTLEPRNEIMKNYKLVPEPNGNVLVYEKFWNENNLDKNIVPAILAYADIVNQGDRRLTETAQKLFDGYLQN